MLAAMAACAVAAPHVAHAQEARLGLEAGWARRFPPSGTDAVQASYALAGLAADLRTAFGSGAWGSVAGGRALDGGGSDWTSATVGGEGWVRVRGPLDLGFALEGYGFRVEEPYTYRALAALVRPRVRLRLGPAHLLGHVEAGGGHSVIEADVSQVERVTRNRLQRTGATPRVRRAETDLWQRSAGAELRVRTGALVWAAGAAWSGTRAGEWRRGHASVGGSIAGTLWQAFASSWAGPAGDEVTGGLVLHVPLNGRWSARASGLRTDPDPLVRTTAASQGGLMLRWDALTSGTPPAPLYALGASTEGGTSVTFRVPAGAARTLALVGDFTDWSPVPMVRAGDVWSAEVRVRPGVYHFGFLADGEWFLPAEGVPGRVSDEWGRENGTLVVPRADADPVAGVTTSRAEGPSSTEKEARASSGPGEGAR
ncbi:MAG: glycogen-binding domain-containing protein [Gemmatimonadota bacterium]